LSNLHKIYFFTLFKASPLYISYTNISFQQQNITTSTSCCTIHKPQQALYWQ